MKKFAAGGVSPHTADSSSQSAIEGLAMKGFGPESLEDGQRMLNANFNVSSSVYTDSIDSEFKSLGSPGKRSGKYNSQRSRGARSVSSTGEQSYHPTPQAQEPVQSETPSSSMRISDARTGRSNAKHMDDAFMRLEAENEDIRAENADLQSRLAAANDEISRLKKSAAADGEHEYLLRQAEVADQRAKTADSRVRDLEKEAQKMIKERTEFQTEVSRLRFELTNKKSTTSGSERPAPLIGQFEAVTDFELERTINDLRTQLHNKENELKLCEEKLRNSDEEVDRLTQHLEEMLGDVEFDEKKKMLRKNWWGGKKKYREGEAAKTAKVIAEELDIAPTVAASEAKTVLDGEIAQARMMKVQAQHKEDMVGIQNALLGLEKDKARLEGEVGILLREKQSIEEKFNRVSAHNDLLKSQQRAASTQQTLSALRSVQLPMPADGSNAEVTRLKVMLQIQEDALRRLATQKEELQDMMDTHEYTYSRHELVTSKKEVAWREDLRSMSHKLTELKGANQELTFKNRELTIQLEQARSDYSNIHKSLKEQTRRIQDQAAKQKELTSTYASMLGSTLHENEDLAVQISRLKALRAKEVETYDGELRVLRAGRVTKGEGEPPLSSVFPCNLPAAKPKPLMPSLRQSNTPRNVREHAAELYVPPTPEEAPTPIESSTSSSSTPEESETTAELPMMPAQMKYNYRWKGGAYHLENSLPPAPNEPRPFIDPHDVPVVRPTVVVETNHQKPFGTRAAPPMVTTEERQFASDALKRWNAAPPPRNSTPERHGDVPDMSHGRRNPFPAGGYSQHTPPRKPRYRENKEPRHR
ncbi:MAG: uncharacterized protein KVP18_001486 [Porospora cf. gigantea A]|uniref:uncharacterized protein n=1 Tax=Porospora cf. gigantea A TaxID=2853593 RepID=UPI00355A3759|nr:MAG: hypothetical protein KVP18_001486 [Porospora cf. gigantea A]